MNLDTLETRTHAVREKTLLNKLAAQVQYAKEHTEYFGRLFEKIDPETINSREALSTLPVTRKSELSTAQKKLPPFGGMNSTPVQQ